MPEAGISRITSLGPGVGSGKPLSSSLRSPRNTTPFMALLRGGYPQSVGAPRPAGPQPRDGLQRAHPRRPGFHSWRNSPIVGTGKTPVNDAHGERGRARALLALGTDRAGHRLDARP